MLFFCLFSLALIASPIQTDTLKVQTSVDKVTVYLSGAEVTRNGALTLNEGINYITIADLPASLNEETIQLFSVTGITFRGVSFINNPAAGEQYADKLNRLESKKKKIEAQIDEQNIALTILAKKMNLLNANQDLTNNSSSISFTDLKGALDYFGEEMAENVQKRADIEKQIKALNSKLNDLNSKIQQIKQLRNQSAGVIRAEIYSPKPQNIPLRLNYVVSSAFWYPTYSLRVQSTDQPLGLVYEANIHQSTGADWENVQLSISSAQPQRNTRIPVIEPIYLDFRKPRKIALKRIRSLSVAPPAPVATAGQRGISTVSGVVRGEGGDPLRAANVLIMGFNKGTATNKNGRFSLNVPSDASLLRISYIGYKTKVVPINSSNLTITLQQSDVALNELVVTGMGAPVRTRMQEGQTAFTIHLDKPYTIKSGEPAKTVSIAQHELKAGFQYITIPRKRAKAYLTAKVTDWSSLNLLPGKANLYLSNAYVGNTVLDFNTTQDTLQFTLGDDEGILVERKKIEAFSEKNFFGSKTTETKGWEITLKNTKNSPIEIKVIDQIPLSSNEDIKVKLTKRSGAVYDSKTGKLTWVIKLKPNETQTVSFVYEIEYPESKEIERAQ